MDRKRPQGYALRQWRIRKGSGYRIAAYGIEVVASISIRMHPRCTSLTVARIHMLDAEALRNAIMEEKPDHIIPEVERLRHPSSSTLKKTAIMSPYSEGCSTDNEP
ncbi:hypothetical protein [Duncaniella dubosii]|uniref:hypothetical protein n=1 Tax=Duncaniella dubosii TaxID=2518971 RepID=UPI003F66ADF9